MMKKIIALALALSMALSMVAFAGYTDADLINEDLTGSIELVNALGIMTGNTDGSFNPKGTLNRAEAAVIVYRLSAGKSDIDASWGDATLNTFTDMDHWSAPYVNYCAALGLIAGYPDGTYRPEAPVTAVEMAKMLLNAAGYDTEKQQYGAKWPAAVLADATNSGLFADYESAYTAAASREWVAKMVSNLILGVKTVAYNVYTDKLEVGNKTFGTEKYGVESVELYALANEEAGIVTTTAEDSGLSKLGAAIDATTGLTNIKFTVDSALLGHKVTVYFKDSDTTDGLSSNDKIYDVVDAAETVIETAMDKIYVDTSSDSTGGLCVNGKVVDADVTATSNVKYYENLAVKSTAPIKSGTSSSYNADSRPVQLVYQDEVWYAFYNNVAYTKVNEHDAEKTTFKTASGLNVTDEDVYATYNFVDEVAEDDYVAIETLNDGSYNVSKIEVLTTKIDSTSSTSTSKTFKVGATTYTASKAYVSGFNMTTFVSNLTEDDLENKTFDIYAIGKYVVYAEATDNSISGFNMNLAYLVDTKDASGSGAFATAAQVQVMLADGSVAIYEYDPTTEDVAYASLEKAHLYNYRVNSDGSIAMTSLASAAAADDGVVEDPSSASFVKGETLSKSYVTTSAGIAYANADSFLFVEYQVEGKAKVAVIKASELKGNMASGYTFRTLATTADEDTGLTTLVYALVVTTNDLPGAAAEDQDYFMATGNPTKVVSSGKTVWTVKGINAQGVAETLTLTSNPGTTKGKIYMISASDETCTLTALSNVSSADTIDDGKWNKVIVTASTNSSVLLAKPTNSGLSGADNEIALGANDLYDLAEDVNIVYVYGTTQKTADLPAKVPFGALQTKGVLTTPAVTHTVGTGSEAKTFTVYTTKGGTDVYKDGTTWKRVDNNTATGEQGYTIVETAVAATDVVVKTTNVYVDANNYVYVLLDAEGVVTDVIVSVESKTDNTLNSIVDDFTFAPAA